MNGLFRLRWMIPVVLGLVLAPWLMRAQEPAAHIRTIHLSPDAPALDAYVLSTDVPPITDNLPFGSAASSVQIKPPGAVEYILTRDGSTTELFGAVLTLQADVRTDVFVLNTFSNIEAAVLEFDYNEKPAAGKAYLRLLGAVPGAEKFDFRILGADGGSFSINVFGFKGATQFIELPAGLLRLNINRAGQQTPFARVQANLQAGIYYTAIASGTVDNFKVRLLDETNALTQGPIPIMENQPSPDEGIARLRVVHAMPTAPAIDMYVEGALAKSGLAFRDASAALPLKPGVRKVSLVKAGDPIGSAFLPADLTLDKDISYTAFVLGEIESSQLPVSVLLGARSISLVPEVGKALVRFVHGSHDAGDVDIRLRDASGQATNVSGVQFRGATNFISMDAGPFSIDLGPVGGKANYRATGTLPADGIVSIVATGSTVDDFLLNVVVESDTAQQIPMAALIPVGRGAVRFAHLSPDAGEVDLFVDGDGSSPIAGTYGAAGQEIGNIFAGALNVAVGPRGAGINGAIITQNVEVKAQTLSTVFAVGSQSAGNLGALVLETPQGPPPAAGTTRVRLLHASPDAGTAEIDLLPANSSSTVYENLNFTSATEYVDVPSGALGVTISRSSAPGETVVVQGTLPDAAVVTLILTGQVVDQTLGITMLVDTKSEEQAPMTRFGAVSDAPIETGRRTASLQVVSNVVGDQARIVYRLDRSQSARVILHNVLGARVGTFEVNGTEGTLMIPVGALPTGVYTALLVGADGRGIAHERFTVVR